VHSSSDGRRGTVRTFWTAGTELAVLASSMEACFDFDTQEGEEPDLPDLQHEPGIRVCDGECQRDDLLGRCFRFRYERTLLTFLLLLASRGGLPRYPQSFERLNRSRGRSGKAPLLDHIEVRSPVLPENLRFTRAEPHGVRLGHGHRTACSASASLSGPSHGSKFRHCSTPSV
jgi:hypothetical protein